MHMHDPAFWYPSISLPLAVPRSAQQECINSTLPDVQLLATTIRLESELTGNARAFLDQQAALSAAKPIKHIG